MTGSFVALGPDAAGTLATFAERYLAVFSPEFAATLASRMPLHDPDTLVALLDRLDAAGCDEFIVVPATVDPAMLTELADVVGDWLGEG